MKRKHKGLFQTYKDLRFGKKLLVSFLIVALVPILIFQIFTLQINTHYFNQQLEELNVNNLEQISERFQLTYESYTDILYQIYMDEQFIQNIVKLYEADKKKHAIAFYQINERLKQFTEAKKGIRSISIVTTEGNYVTYDAMTGSSLDSIWRDTPDLRQSEPYRAAQKQDGTVLLPTKKMLDNGKPINLFFVSKKIYDIMESESGSVATVILCIDESVLEELCSETNAEREKNSVSFIADVQGKILTYPDKQYIGSMMNKSDTAQEFVEETGIFSNTALAENSFYDKMTGWTYYNVYNRQYLVQGIMRIRMITSGIVLAVSVFIIILIHFMSKNISNSVERLVNGIKKVKKGDFDTEIAIESEDEFGEIGRHLNLMTVEIKRLLTEIEEMSEKKKKAEIQALEAQINPHFLYNTLDAINWLAIENEEYVISKMLRNLGAIFRYSINKIELADVNEVAEWLKSYVDLYQLRYDHTFSFQLQIQEEAYPFKLHKLLLQPIVENAIVHGMKEIEEGGKISVVINYLQEKGKLHIVVEDNGAGMPDEQVKRYNSRIVEDAGKRDGIGVANVLERMEMYYGQEADWLVNSAEGKGTIIELVIPAIVVAE